MKCASIVLAILAGLAGLIAAWYWHRSAQVEAPPFQKLASVMTGPDGETPINRWARETAERNRVAALWTAASVILAAASSVVGAIG